jgi:hypothetical protein
VTVALSLHRSCPGCGRRWAALQLDVFRKQNLTKGSLAGVCALQFILPNLSHLYFAFNFNLVDVNF